MIPVRKRKIVISVLLYFATLGLYRLHWQYLLIKNIRAIRGDQSRCTGEVLRLTFIPFYGIYWWYTRGKLVREEFAKLGYKTRCNEIVYLILAIAGLNVVSHSFMQHDFNKLPNEAIPIMQIKPIISKRDALPFWKRLLIRAGAFVSAIVVCALMILIVAKSNPFSVFASFFKGFKLNLLPSIYSIAILLGISLAVTPAFKMKFWNIGAEGQALVGALATAIIMIVLGGKLPDPVVTVFMLLSAVIAGMIWAIIPAFFKAHWKTNETLFTLMMNYIAIECVNLLLEICGGPSHVVGRKILVSGRLISLYKPYVIPIIVVGVLAVIMFFYLKMSKQGYEISVVGESENTAKYIGINVKKVIIRTMAISGAICGLIGFLIVGGVDFGINKSTIGGRGFTAIMVSWLSKFNPFVMIFTSFMIVFLEKGSKYAESKFNLIDSNFSNVLIGIILFFLIGCEFFIEYRVHISKTYKEAQK